MNEQEQRAAIDATLDRLVRQITAAALVLGAGAVVLAVAEAVTRWPLPWFVAVPLYLVVALQAGGQLFGQKAYRVLREHLAQVTGSAAAGTPPAAGTAAAGSPDAARDGRNTG